MAFVVDGHDAGHTDVLDHAEVGEVFLAEGHPEAGAADGGIVFHEAFNLLVVQQIALAGTDFGIGERLVDFEGFSFHPLAVFPVKAFLCDFANVDFGVEIRGESLVVVAGVAVHDVEVLDFIEMMLGGIGSVDARYARVEAAAENSGEAGLFEAFLVCPLPGILKVCLVLRLVVGRVEVGAPALQAGFHDCEVLVGEGEVHHEVGLELIEKRAEFFHVVSVHARRLDVGAADGVADGVALRLRAAGNHYFRKHIAVLRHFVRGHRGHAAGADDKDFSHYI